MANPAALSGVDPDDLTPDQRVDLFALAVLDREAKVIREARDRIALRLNDVAIHPSLREGA